MKKGVWIITVVDSYICSQTPVSSFFFITVLKNFHEMLILAYIISIFKCDNLSWIANQFIVIDLYRYSCPWSWMNTISFFTKYGNTMCCCKNINWWNEDSTADSIPILPDGNLRQIYIRWAYFIYLCFEVSVQETWCRRSPYWRIPKRTRLLLSARVLLPGCEREFDQETHRFYLRRRI